MSANSAQINSSLDRFCAAWKTNDGALLGGFFTEDGSLINPFGERADGRVAVAAMYSQYFGSMLRGTTTAIHIDSFREVGPDHAFVDFDQPIYAPDGSVALALHVSALLRRQGDDWRFVDARPHAYTPMPTGVSA